MPGDRDESAKLASALARWADADAPAIHGAELRLAELVVELAGPASHAHLALAQRFVSGEPLAAELAEAKQECWTYVGSLACGCSLADSASAHVMLTSLETSAAAHTPSSLAEQAERVLRCGAELERVLTALAPGDARGAGS